MNIISQYMDKFQVSGWTIAGTILFAILIADQGMLPSWGCLIFLSWIVRYQTYKRGIAGPRFTIPIMGAFLASMNPKFSGYVKQWKSGELSCVSVFHQ